MPELILPKAGDPMPKSIGLCADEYASVRELRLAMEKLVASVKERETEIKEHIIRELPKSDNTGAAGKKYRAQIVTKDQPTLRDWDAFTAYVAKYNRFDMLTKRLADKAVKDTWEAGEAVPGIEKFKTVDVSITKL